MDKYVIGIDGGSSKSHLALFDAEGTLKDFQCWGPLNYEVMNGSFDQFEQELGEFLSKTLQANGITQEHIAYSVIGMAGVDTPAQHGIISAIITKLGLCDFLLCNDAYIGIPAASPTGAGICAINGSGCSVAAIDTAGRMLQIGGRGMLTWDIGGGGMIGDLVIGTVYKSLFRLGPPTLLTKLLFEKLGITNKYELMETLFTMTSKGYKISVCNRLVFEAAHQSDPVAINILREIATNYANTVIYIIREMEFPASEPLHVLLAGSVFVKAEHPIMTKMFQTQLDAAYPERNITYTVLEKPPVAGAAVWALKSLKGEGNYIDKVCSQLHEGLWEKK